MTYRTVEVDKTQTKNEQTKIQDKVGQDSSNGSDLSTQVWQEMRDKTGDAASGGLGGRDNSSTGNDSDQINRGTEKNSVDKHLPELDICFDGDVGGPKGSPADVGSPSDVQKPTNSDGTTDKDDLKQRPKLDDRKEPGKVGGADGRSDNPFGAAGVSVGTEAQIKSYPDKVVPAR